MVSLMASMYMMSYVCCVMQAELKKRPKISSVLSTLVGYEPVLPNPKKGKGKSKKSKVKINFCTLYSSQMYIILKPSLLYIICS